MGTLPTMRSSDDLTVLLEYRDHFYLLKLKNGSEHPSIHEDLHNLLIYQVTQKNAPAFEKLPAPNFAQKSLKLRIYYELMFFLGIIWS